jgi:hypothetical protein
MLKYEKSIMADFFYSAHINLLSFQFIGLDAPIVNISTATPKESDNVILTCDVNTTYAILNYEWFHDGIGIVGEKSKEYPIFDVRRSNAGNYSCKVVTQSVQRTSVTRFVTIFCK